MLQVVVNDQENDDALFLDCLDVRLCSFILFFIMKQIFL